MKLSVLGALIFVGWSTAVQSQQHIHGQGSVFIVQEDDLWQVQFILPASDILGFEHRPENQQQQQLLEQFEEKQKHFENLIKFDSQCTQRNDTHTAFELGESEHEEEHGHQHKDDHEGEDDHEHADSHEHNDIDILYLIECADDVSQVSFPILNPSNNLQNLEVQWSTQAGQGSTMINANQRQLRWP
ncbi:MAG: DUF2796 domain-containing protein [Aliiglaciecola sp.]|uniref:ZrgA family zinc uptake protein n=1 Tax=Aliiglaciecola sp. TaxID=1872441 RepID=UPI003299FC82